MVDFSYGAPKTCQLFKVSVILPPSGKISAGAHDGAVRITEGGAVRITEGGAVRIT